MRRVSLFILFATVFFVAVPVIASQNRSDDTSIGEYLQADQGAYVRKVAALTESDPVLLAEESEFNDFPIFGEDIYSADHRSISRSFLYSFLVPGLGEYYCGSKIKAGVFFAFDLLSWAQYATKHTAGTDKEDEFQKFANAHWSPTRYMVHIIEEYGVDSDTLVDGYSHRLPDEKTQQYYEMIGKYEQFVYGWDDVESDKSIKNRSTYLVMRKDANDKLDAARTWVMVSLANHFLSAFDAALSAKRFNKKRDVFSTVNVKARLAEYDGRRIPKIELTYKFY